VGNIFKLGSRYSKAADCTYLDQEGKERFILMGSYGIGLGRLMACIAEENHDDRGLTWPLSVSSFSIHLIALSGKNSQVNEQAELVYSNLMKNNFEPLYDDRQESPGIKFKDADLIGLPLRITVSEKSLDQGGVEMKLRCEEEKKIVPINQVIIQSMQWLKKS
jgi:prolyl-tRNA synthetase